MKIASAILAGIVLVFTSVLASAAPQEANINDLAPIAAGRTKAAHSDVLNARLLICAKALGTDTDTNTLSKWMVAKKFSNEAQRETLDTCIAFATGVAVGVSLNSPRT